MHEFFSDSTFIYLISLQTKVYNILPMGLKTNQDFFHKKKRIFKIEIRFLFIKIGFLIFSPWFKAINGYQDL